MPHDQPDRAAVQFIPHNAQEHDNDVRAIVIGHMQRNGDFGQNPTQWVVTAAHEAFAKGFAMGFNAAREQTRQQQRDSVSWRNTTNTHVADALPPHLRRLSPPEFTDTQPQPRRTGGDDTIDLEPSE